MTLDDAVACEEIRHTLATYNHAGDSDDAAGYAATFAQDALFEAPGFSLSGRDAIHAWKLNHSVFAGGASGRPASFRIHHVSTMLIDVLSPDRAKAKSNWMAMTEIGPDHAGRYIDDLRKTDEGWRIAHRRVEVLWRAPNSFIGEEQMSQRIR